MKKKETKTETMRFRVTPTEAERIVKYAAESQMLIADYLRKVVLRGITFRVEENIPEPLHVQSISVRRVEEDGEKMRKHGAG